jgi:hypothetical protein
MRGAPESVGLTSVNREMELGRDLLAESTESIIPFVTVRDANETIRSFQHFRH